MRKTTRPFRKNYAVVISMTKSSRKLQPNTHVTLLLMSYVLKRIEVYRSVRHTTSWSDRHEIIHKGYDLFSVNRRSDATHLQLAAPLREGSARLRR